MEVSISQQVTQDQRISQLTLQETHVSKMKDALDESGQVIKETGQFVENEGWWIAIRNQKQALQAAIMVVPAAKSRFARITGIPETALTTTYVVSSVWVAPNAQQNEVLPTILYFGLRRGRIEGYVNIATLIPVPNREVPYATLMRLTHLNNWPSVKQDNVELQPLAQQIKYSMSELYEHCSGEGKILVDNHLIDEVVQTHKLWLDRFYSGSWAQAVLTGTLKREQYIVSLYNTHQYVRQTTRLAARCVAHSENIDLRNHYINHFKGEINHELLVERDLKNLGGDVDYLKKRHVPDPATKEFMVVQESTIGYYQDPILMLACPMAAEGIAANMPDGFIDALHKTIASWGIDKPEECARFLSSHINTDGGEDGHWLAVVNSIKKWVRNEWQLQTFLSVLTGAMNGVERGFNANVDDMKIWSAQPKQ